MPARYLRARSTQQEQSYYIVLLVSTGLCPCCLAAKPAHPYMCKPGGFWSILRAYEEVDTYLPT